MTQQRAQYILDNPAGFGFRWAFPSPLNKPPFYTGMSAHEQLHCEDGITPEEYNFVWVIWNCMGPGASFSDAVEQIAKGL